jgi:ribosome-associated translation inhibitor RaiA
MLIDSAIHGPLKTDRNLLSCEVMRIEVAGSPAECANGLRAYAEYRVFSRLASMGDLIGTVRVIVRTLARGPATSCLLVADLDAAGPIQARAQSTEPSTAIDMAVTRLEAAIRDRLSRRAG